MFSAPEGAGWSGFGVCMKDSTSQLDKVKGTRSLCKSPLLNLSPDTSVLPVYGFSVRW